MTTFEAPRYKNANNNAFTPDLTKPVNPLTYLTDSYKVSHKFFEIEGVQEIYSNFTARFDKYIAQMVGAAWDKHYVVFGVQYAMIEMQHLFQTGFFNRPKAEVMAEMKDIHIPYIGANKFDHFEDLHDLGYLPIAVKALPEGTLAPVGCPFLTVCNTHPKFEWLTNFIESFLSVLIWKPLTVATVARYYRLTTNEFALKTTGSLVGTEWQNHDFHVRGASGWQSAAINGCAFLLSSCGTDNMPSLEYAQRYFGSKNGESLLAGSVAAGEHSVTTLGILTYAEAKKEGLAVAEEMYVRYVLSKFPTGIVSYVADSFDFWTLITVVLPLVKNEIMQREGKFVVRGDSGDPVKIITGYVVTDFSKYQTLQDFLESPSSCQRFEAIKLGNGQVYADESKVDMYGEFVKKYAEVTEVEVKGTIERLWEIFGGTTNELGYKVLDEHIGMIYGDGITLERQQQILERLEAKGFASTNIVFGVGSYALNLLSRDHLGMAIKATNAVVEINGELVDKPIYKDPKTDSTKKSARGLLWVCTAGNRVVAWNDCVTRLKESQGALRLVYENGKLYNLETLFTMRERLWS